MEDCDQLELIRLEGGYLRFIVETHAELNILEHLEKCGDCRRNIKKHLDSDTDTPGLGSLFHVQADDPTVPRRGDHPNPDAFIDARIQWRKKHLAQLIENAEMELQDLRKRITR